MHKLDVFYEVRIFYLIRQLKAYEVYAGGQGRTWGRGEPATAPPPSWQIFAQSPPLPVKFMTTRNVRQKDRQV